MTGEEFGYTNWAAGEPNNASSIENYLMIYNASDTVIAGIWNDATNATAKGFICEFEPSGPVSVSGSIRSYRPNDPATIQLLQNGREIHKTYTQIKSGSGEATQPFTIYDVAPGDYTLVVTKPGHASYTLQNITVGNTNLDLTQDPRPEVRRMTLPCGDISGDNMINDGDLAVLWLAANYNKNAEQANKLCDLNGDGMINDGDLAILWLAVNYNKGAVVIP